MEMEDQYGMTDLRQYMNGRSLFPPPGDLFSGHRNLTQAQQHPYEMVMVGRHHQVSATADMVVRGLHHHEFRSDSTTATTTTTTAASVGAASSASLNGLEMEGGGSGAGLGVDVGTGRWPRQETLTLLEVRSKLDCKFKEANQKGPLWDEVSRIMCEEHGYQRSGKKCREKFENLYKYYKKTKEGKAGRQDGKHYRFFRQLEALYGGDTTTPVSASETHLVGNNFRFHESSNNNTQANQECSFQPPPKLCDSLSLSNSSEFDTSSSYDNDINPGGGLMDDDDSMEKKKKKKMRRRRRSWKAKIRDFIDSQMRKLMEKQEELLEKMIKALERKEQERMSREEEWRAQEAARIEREHKFWANERAWIEVRDAALMEALQKVTDKAVKASSPEVLMGGAELRGETQNENGSETITSWPESETTKLIQLRNSMDSRFQQSGCSEEVLWEGIAAKMACLGYDRSALMCKDKWDSINNFLRKTNKKRKENSKNCCYFQNSESVHNQGRAYCEINGQGPEITTRVAPNDNATATIAAAAATTMHDSCFRFLVGIEGDNLWDSYGVKLSKGENH